MTPNLLARRGDRVGQTARRRWRRWAIGAAILVVALLAGGPFVYIHFVEGPAPAALALAPARSTSAADPALAGTWTATTGSTAGYRVRETLIGQRTTAVGRTTAVAGAMTITGTRVMSASFTVDLASVTSDRKARDARFRGPIMDTARYPTARFVLTRPIALAPLPRAGVITKYSATGRLTVHGTTHVVTIPLTAERAADAIAVQGIVTITFADYGVANPSFGPAHVGDTGQLEFVLHLRRS